MYRPNEQNLPTLNSRWIHKCMGSKWNLAIGPKQSGTLDEITEFDSPIHKQNQKESSLPLRVVEIIIPINQDIKKQ